MENEIEEPTRAQIVERFFEDYRNDLRDTKQDENQENQENLENLD